MRESCTARHPTARLSPLELEHRVLVRALAKAQERCSFALAEKAAQIDELRTELLSVRAQLAARDSRIAGLLETLGQLQGGQRGRPAREHR